MTKPPRALFSSARDALRFALNHEDLSIPGPTMNAAMAESPQPPFKGGASGGGVAQGPVSRRQESRNVPLGGMSDRTLMSGWILLRLATLSIERRSVLEAVLINPRRLCPCGRACCRGWLVKVEWVQAIRLLCSHLELRADLAKVPGKRGLSTDPRLRQALVEDYCRIPAKRASVADLVDITDVTAVTVAKHREMVHSYLTSLEFDAWAEINEIFDTYGITGHIEN